MSRYTLNKYTSRLMAVLLVLMLLLSTAPNVRADGESGTCGEDLFWSLSAGTLTITGSGDMMDFPESTMAPWYHLREEILRLELPEGVTSLGMLAFYGCENLTVVTIPDSVTRIGSYAFAGCKSMEMLNLGSGVTAIGECAFSDCVNMAALRLPSTLQSIGMKAFYRCESIGTVTIPASVTSIGISAFAYCKSLVSADIQALITVVPEWMFYGCERLTTVTLPNTTGEISKFAFRGCDQLNSVHYGGTSLTQGQIQNMIADDVPSFDGTGNVTDEVQASSSSAGIARDNGDGTFTQTNTTITQTENASVTAEIETTRREDGAGISSSANISVTVTGEDGWQEAQDAVGDALTDFNSSAAASGGENQGVEVNVYVQGTDTVDPEFVDSLAGRDVRLTITTENGSSWRMDGTQLDSEIASGAYDLRYTLSAGTAELNAELETDTSFVLRFESDAHVNAEVLINLGKSLARQNATLFQRDGGELIRHQTVVVDADGYAHFYLASVNDRTNYYIAINLTAEEEAIIPEEMLEEYGSVVNYNPIEYEITGRTSSWGMTFSQVTWIMIAVLVGCVVIVGFVMYGLNKRKLKMGYIPDLEEEYE